MLIMWGDKGVNYYGNHFAIHVYQITLYTLNVHMLHVNNISVMPTGEKYGVWWGFSSL